MLRAALLLTLIISGCCADSPRSPPPPTVTRNQPDPTTIVQVQAEFPFEEQVELAERIGAARAFTIATDEGVDHIVITFVPHSEAPGKNLQSFASSQDAAFIEAIGPRDIVPIEVMGADLRLRPLGIPYIARVYLNRAGEENAICDAAALRFETAGGFWTISWNAPLGGIQESTAQLELFMDGVRVLPLPR